MIDEKTKSDIRQRLNEAKADSAPMDANAFALHYSADSKADHKELVDFICEEARRAGASVRGCQGAN